MMFFKKKTEEQIQAEREIAKRAREYENRTRSAFPEVRGHSNSIYTEGGMAMRDYFAAAALTGIMASNAPTPANNSEKIIARAAYIMADAMLNERAQ